MAALDYGSRRGWGGVGWGTSADCMCRHVCSWPGQIALSGRTIHHARTGDNSAVAGQIRTCTSVVQICVRNAATPPQQFATELKQAPY
jgi:hypothetical protein